MDVDRIRKDFPLLSIEYGGKKIAYFDNAATSQKPVQVIDKISDYYRTYNANIHRGIYKISEKATEAYIESKEKAAKLINTDSYSEIVYTKNATDAINLAAIGWGTNNIKKGDHILITEMEHHSNIVPWQMLAKKREAVLDYVNVDRSTYTLDEESLEKGLEKNPKIFAFTHVSNVLGTINDAKKLTRKAHEAGTVVLLDGAQSVPHMGVDIKDIGADIFAFSSHKMLGPAGIGVLYAKRDILESMDPLITGGDMILSVEKQSSTWNDIPWKFEAGTSNVEGGIGFGAAIDYLNAVGMDNIKTHETGITKYALESLAGIEKVKTYGPAIESAAKGGIVSFSIQGVHPHDIATIFDSQGIAIRAGHHCAMPLIKSVLELPAAARMSFYLYSTMEEVDRAVQAIKSVKETFHIR